MKIPNGLQPIAGERQRKAALPGFPKVPRLHAEKARQLARAALLACFLGAGLVGCVSKAKAKAQARAAYLAGQQEATIRLQQSQIQSLSTPGVPRIPGGLSVPTPTVRITGPVRNPVVPWTQGLSLMKAIVTADYGGATDPADILLLRRGVATRVDVQKLLGGQDIPLQPDDVIELVLPAAGTVKAQP